MKKRILELLTSHGTLISPETMKYIFSKEDPEHYIQDIMKQFQEFPLFLTEEILKSAEAKLTGSNNEANQNLEEETSTSSLNNKPPENLQIEAPATQAGIATTKKPVAKDYDGEVKILKDVTGESTSEGTMQDFNKYFQIRFQTLRKILQNQRREVIGAGEIAQIKSRAGPVKFIGIVNSVRDTKQGHKIIELEDDTDSISVLINNSSTLINMNFVNDEVLCIIGKLGKSDLIYAEEIIQPEVPIARERNKAELPLNCLFLADIHIGSSTFLHKPWEKLIRWLNGKYTIPGSEEFLDKLKYIVVSGDVVDGIGIYPNQEDELEISDIYAQYEDLADKFQNIPEHIQIIAQPGNHDAVRPAEPQPTFPAEITNLFSNDITFVGNPCYFSLNNVEILSYHGRSMDDFVMQIPNVTYNTPIKIMKEMLARRHMAPIYGQKTPIAPEHQDYLLIDKVPDIFVTGHIHKTAFENYRDISLMNASAWQAQTTYQKMMNFNPDPGKAIIANLQSHEVKILNFA